jgi:prepilin-type N-terminal cleavage/methylation domain-containing protein
MKCGFEVTRGSRINRSAFTLIELLTVIGVVGLLAALLLPAVQGAREAARRVQCSACLRQINLALQQYEGVHQVYPAVSMYAYSPNEKPSLAKEYSVYTRLLPYLEETVAYDSINFSVGLRDPYLFPMPPGGWANATAIAHRVSTFLCPSDSSDNSSLTAGCNYRVNLGSSRTITPSSDSSGGPLNAFGNASPAGVRDGLSNTVAFAERLRGRESGASLNGRTDMVIGFVLGDGYTPDEAAASCASKRGAPYGYYTIAGRSWFVGSPAHTCYNHLLEPNSPVADCVILASPIYGLVGSRSNHPGGVYAGMADGSARFISDSVQYAVWRALGTRANGEVVSQEGY